LFCMRTGFDSNSESFLLSIYLPKGGSELPLKFGISTLFSQFYSISFAGIDFFFDWDRGLGFESSLFSIFKFPLSAALAVFLFPVPTPVARSFCFDLSIFFCRRGSPSFSATICTFEAWIGTFTFPPLIFSRWTPSIANVARFVFTFSTLPSIPEYSPLSTFIVSPFITLILLLPYCSLKLLAKFELTALSLMCLYALNEFIYLAILSQYSLSSYISKLLVKPNWLSLAISLPPQQLRALYCLFP